MSTETLCIYGPNHVWCSLGEFLQIDHPDITRYITQHVPICNDKYTTITFSKDMANRLAFYKFLRINQIENIYAQFMVRQGKL